MKINIAIDGPGAAGKSTIAKRLARSLQYVHLDTGAMYRCCAYEAFRNEVDIDNDVALNTMLDNITIRFDTNNNVFINGEDVSKQIRSNDNGMRASLISQKSVVRKKMVSLQQDMAKDKGFILDGRDVGTVVLPQAQLKIYLVASVESRAQRRYKECLENGQDVDLERISEDLKQRDYQDMNRAYSPLRKAEDAVEVDTSNMSIEEVVAHINTLLVDRLIIRKQV